jgi:hypothetical protein
MDQNSQRFALWELQQEIFSLFLKKENVFLENKKEHSTNEVREHEKRTKTPTTSCQWYIQLNTCT